MSEFLSGLKRGRSQIMFQYLPGSVFSENNFWFKVDLLKVRQFSGKTDHLLNFVYQYADNWQANGDLETQLFPKINEMYYFGEVEEVQFEMFPLTFYCKTCGNVHPYWDIENVYRQNPKLKCEFCTKGQLKQYPYALIHNNGDIQPIKVATNEGKSTWKEKYDGIRMKDTRTFKTATWFNFKRGRSLGDLGTKATTLPLTRTMKANRKRMMGGTHLSDGSVFYPALKVFVNLKHDTLTERINKENFVEIQLGALLGLESVNRKNFEKNFEASNSDVLMKLMRELGGNDEMKNALLQFASKENISVTSSGNNTVDEVRSLFSMQIPTDKVINDQSLHEFIFSWYENSGETIVDRIKEAHDIGNVEMGNVYSDAYAIATNFGLDNVLLLEKFPVLMMGIGFTRRSADRKNSILNPFKQKAGGRNRILIPILKNENEAILFKLDPLRVAAWLFKNNLLEVELIPKTKDKAHAMLYNYLLFSDIDQEQLSQFKPEDFIQNKPVVATIMVFRLLHSYMHSLFQAGKTILGLDIDSLSEYLFPSALTGAIYVSKLQGGGMGALISAFDNDLKRWMEGLYDKSNTCLYDPVCHQHTGACHACMYLKFSCCNFNNGLTRNLLVGGKIQDYDDTVNIIGYFDPQIDELVQQWEMSLSGVN